ncbi:FtsB family cell division protein [Streptomyces indicus]|uniref:Septum formation initiator n=1 Tax=Streptomyces indicus TaxID=417292 RepID=A0A1G8YXA7_9ACTN|nr:septum formation initiator family protein [Streptomyces indicus]SDK07492.1 Septum formation initiator [Streptomyces indicus]
MSPRGVAQLRGRAARLARLLPAGPASAARTPFVLLIVVLLGGGLIVLLMLNSALNQGSFQLSKLKRETTELTDQQQQLENEVDGYSAPDALERRARELGMVPGGAPAFLDPDGKVRGTPGVATAPPAPVKATPKPTAPAPTVSVSPAPDGSASAAPSEEPAPGASGEPASGASGEPVSGAAGRAASPSPTAPTTSPSPSTTPGR